MEDRDWELALPLELGNTIGEVRVIEIFFREDYDF